MFYRVIFLLFVSLLFSCYHENRPEVSVPGHLLNEKEMVDILTDVHLAEGAIVYRRTRRIEQQNFRESAYNQIFLTYGITAKILNENLNYYNNKPEQMEHIYEEVLANLSRIQGELKKASIQSGDTVN